MLCAIHSWTLSITDLRYMVHHFKMAIGICDPKQFPTQRTALQSWDWDQHVLACEKLSEKDGMHQLTRIPISVSQRVGMRDFTSVLVFSKQETAVLDFAFWYYSTCLIWWATEKQAIPALIRFLFLAHCVQQPVIIMGYMAAAHNQIIRGEKALNITTFCFSNNNHKNINIIWAVSYSSATSMTKTVSSSA